MKKRFWCGILVAVLLLGGLVGCNSQDTTPSAPSEPTVSNVSSAPETSAPATSSPSSQPSLSLPEQPLTGEYNGQTITLTYTVTDVTYPWDMRSIPFVNGYAVFYDYSWYTDDSATNPYPGDTWNAIDTSGNVLFDEPYGELTYFNAEGVAAAKKYDGSFVLVNAKGEETPITEQQYKDFDTGYDHTQQESLSVLPEKGVAGSYVYNGLALYVEETDEPGHYLLGVADNEGNVVIPASIPISYSYYTEHLSLQEDTALVEDLTTHNMLILTLTRSYSEKAYNDFLEDLYSQNPEKDTNAFFLKDLDNNGIDELILLHAGTEITVYTFKEAIKEVGKHDFLTGTLRLLYSNDSSYPGIFYFTVEGGADHYGYLTIKNDQLSFEKLWDDNYSSAQENSGIRIVEYTTDQKLIEESKTAYKENQDISRTPLEHITAK